jgi:hypothetical protein
MMALLFAIAMIRVADLQKRVVNSALQTVTKATCCHRSGFANCFIFLIIQITGGESGTVLVTELLSALQQSAGAGHTGLFS